MRIKKGSKTDIRLRFRNIVTAAIGIGAIAGAYNKRLKYYKKDKIGWLVAGVGTLVTTMAIRKILDDNFIPEKEDQPEAQNMKEVSEGNVN